MLSSTPSQSPSPHTADEIRRWIVRELSGSLNVPSDSIDTTAPLESLGVDSLAALGMTGGLAGYLGRDLPATLVWDYPSIDAIAAGLADPEPPAKVLPPGVIEFQSADQTPDGVPPVFFLPGLGGHPVTFAEMAGRLSPAHRCFGLTVPGLDGRGPLLTTVPEIAGEMLRAVRRIQSTGPYQLAGYSFGGLLAYEMAQQLSAAGEPVSLLAIYDAFTPQGRVPKPRWRRALIHLQMLLRSEDRLAYLRSRIARRAAQRSPAAADTVDEAAASSPAGSQQQVKDVARVNKAAAAAYQPQPCRGPVLVFRATVRSPHEAFYQVDPSNGWGRLAAGGVTVIDLPGRHLGLLDGARAETAAEALRPHLLGSSPEMR